jgi:outer membrane beta-barrel protein
MRKAFLLILIIMFLFCGIKVGFGAESNDDGHVYAIQERVFHRYHEIGLSLGYIPDDDFYNVYPVGVDYTFNFDDYLAWEVLRAEMMLTQEKDLKGKLESSFGVTPSEFSEPKYMIHTSLVLKPFYGKEAVWNRSIVNHESYFFLGGGMINYERQFSYGEPADEDALSINLGFGTRYFLSKSLCVNFEIRDLISFREEKTDNNIFLGISLGFRFNLSPRKADRDQTLDKLKDYLSGSEADD